MTLSSDMTANQSITKLKRKFIGDVVMTTCEVFVAEHIDDRLRSLIVDLNKAGWTTVSSCQGRTEPGDSHTPHAFISFGRGVSKAFAGRIMLSGLCVYNGDLSIGTNVFEDTPDHRAIAENSTFVTRVRELFDLD
jgi:hypothetical protein